ncbi:cytochrome P450 [Mycena leptocephala]|nr:cytochrome P450 [Mycena leptocephala]
MDYRSSLALCALIIVLFKFFSKRLWQRSSDLPFPPGPSPRPVIGNARELPTKLPWLTYKEWGLQYVVPMIELMGWDFNVGLMRLGDRWRHHRRMFQQHFRRDMSRNYRPVQMRKVHALLLGLLSTPQEFRDLLKTPTNDRFVTLSENAVKKLSDSFFPGAVAVNTFPILRYLPAWFPGAGFQSYAAECRQLTQEMRAVPFGFAKQNMQKLLEASQARNRSDEQAIQEVAATAYALGRIAHQQKAQSEIDTVIGIHRLPEFEDRPSLPFVEALYREVMRWKPVTPLGMAHAASADDIYNGYFIPKGSHFAERFSPDRFFTVDGELNDDDTVLTFGLVDRLNVLQYLTPFPFLDSGRRICVGRHTADATVWATIVSVLSTFNIAKAMDAAGHEIDIESNYSDGLVSHPQHFACSITPRSETAKNLVQATAEVHEF